LGKAPAAESLAYISTDKTGRYLFGASYSANLISVNPINRDGTASGPQQVIPTARNAHAIIIDRTNRYVFVPHLGTDQILQFVFDENTGKLSANTPPLVQMKSGIGPRHPVISADNMFLYVLGEMAGTITTLALDQKSGLLNILSEAKVVSPDSKLVPGTPRRPAGQGEEPASTRANDIWTADVHLTPNGKYLYASERTLSTIATLSVDAATGKLSYVSSTSVEKQPRSFAIDPSGKYMVVSGQLSDTISTYAIADSGALTFLRKYPTGKGSNWVEIVHFD
jgi:6-phosphogluconolactonase